MDLMSNKKFPRWTRCWTIIEAFLKKPSNHKLLGRLQCTSVSSRCRPPVIDSTSSVVSVARKQKQKPPHPPKNSRKRRLRERMNHCTVRHGWGLVPPMTTMLQGRPHGGWGGRLPPAILRRQFAVTATSSNSRTNRVVDLRSDTVTRPSDAMLRTALTAPLGDDVMGEDPTVTALQDRMASMFHKERALYVPTGTMANLVAMMAHCDHTRAAEIVVGATSHINLWEGGNASNLGGIHTRQVTEDENGEMDPSDVMDCVRKGEDDHWPTTTLLCLENTHNMAGGVALSKAYVDRMADLAHGTMKSKIHVDGARIFNSALALGTTVGDLCDQVDSVSVCLSKGLGAPLGSVLVGDADFIRLAKRARKRCGGGMRQAGVVAAMGLYAVENHVDRLAEDHRRAQAVAAALLGAGFHLPRNGRVDTNIVYFALPEGCPLERDEFLRRLAMEYGVKLTGGYSTGGRLFRAVTHMDVNDEDVQHAIEGIVRLGTGGT